MSKSAKKISAAATKATRSSGATTALLGGIERVLCIDGLSAPENRPAATWALRLAAVAVFLRIIFWWYTQRYWEDALITCLHSENFVLGLGMTHVRPGEPPLHGFTSPLSVLVPLIGDLIHVGFGIEFIKLVSIPCAAATVFYLVGIGIHPSVRLPLPLIVMVAGYAAFEHHQILFGMAGMETQMAVLVMVASLYHAIAWHPKRLGIWLGLCMLARPDFAFWCAVMGAYGLWRDWRRVPVVVGWALAIYLPWIVFTLYEYGSPMPNTIVAKGLGTRMWYDNLPGLTPSLFFQGTWMMLTRSVGLCLAPTFMGHGNVTHIFFFRLGWGSPIADGLMVVAVIGLLAIVYTRQYFLIPLAGGTLVYTLYYVYLVPVMACWYKPPYVLILLLLCARGLQALADFIPDETLRRRVLKTFVLCYLGLFLFVLPFTFFNERQIQRLVEDPVRKAAALYLHDHMKPGEAVGCEPLGYMSYYSRGVVYDWPGLDSRKVVAWSKSQPREKRRLENMLMALQPEWIFVREIELLNFQNRDWFVENYHPIKQFAVSEADKKRILWVENNVDTNFWILKKNHPGDGPYPEPEVAIPDPTTTAPAQPAPPVSESPKS